MSPRKTILRELTDVRSEDEKRYTRPGTIRGFDGQPSKYQSAVNELLKDRLIDGVKDDEGQMAIAINAHKLAEVRKELRPWFARPIAWLATAAGIAGIFLALAGG